MINALTVDLEDWYHICGIKEYEDPEKWGNFESRINRNAERILKILKAYDVKATFFLLGYIAEKQPSIVKKIMKEGHEIATHGHFHRRVSELTATEFEDDLCKSKEIIEEITGKPVLGFRAPEWSIRNESLWALDILKKNGIVYDSSMVPLTGMGERWFPQFPTNIYTRYGNIVEFPLTTSRCLWERIPLTGGRPLRMTPYWLILHTIVSINKEGYPCIVYVHPWEFDKELPPLKLSFVRRFIHHFRVKSTAPKIEGLLKHLRFGTVIDVLKTIGLVKEK